MRHAILIGLTILVMLVAAAAATSEADAAPLGDWKQAMVAANEQLEQPVTIHPRLNYRNSWGFAARATAWRLSNRLDGIPTSARLTNALKAFLRPYRPYRDYEPLMNTWEKRMKKARRHAKAHARMLGTKVPKRLLAPITDCYLPYDHNCGEYDFEAWAYVYRKRTLALRRYVKATWRKMRYPDWRHKGARAWLPLLKHQGFPKSQLAMAVKVIRRESNGNPRCVNSSSGAAGLFQFMPFWWQGQGWNPLNPVHNINRAKRAVIAQGGWLPAWSLTAY